MTDRRFTARIRSARSAVAAERERTVAEREAFEAFERRVGALSSQRPNRSGGFGKLARSLSRGSSSATASALDRVCAAYRETVLELSHYDEEYGEPLLDNLAAEFGEEIGTAVAGGVFSAELKAALCTAAREAASRRATFVSVLEEEREALDDAARELRDIGEAAAGLDADIETARGASFASLREVRERFCALDRRCEGLAERRQERLRGPRAGGQWPRDDGASLNEYLYAPLDVTYPILADASDAAATLREERRRVERALTHTV
jgi:hypothetical protein